MLQKIREIFVHWWSEFALQTKLMAVGTLAVSLLMSGLTFWAVNTIQQDARFNDTRFGRDLGLLLATNTAPMLAENDLTGIAQFSSRFYRSTSSVRYLIYADRDGDIFFGIPYSEAAVENSLTIKRRIQLPDNYNPNSEIPFIKQHLTPNGEITDVFIPLINEGNYLGVLALGINPNPTVAASSNLTRDVTIAVFVSIWAMVILGAVFNALTITRPIKELVVGVKNIAAGNFKQRVDLPLGGELGELIYSFNEMAEKLERYEEQNIEELTAEKAKLETLVSTIADGAVLLDPELNTILVNPAARKMFAWIDEDVIGKNVLHHLPPALTVKLTRPLYQISKGETTGQESSSDHEHNYSSPEYRITLNEPNQRIFRVFLNQVLDQSKEIIKGIGLTVQDITREVELNEAKGQFISNVSHELRTPLFNIKSFIETLCEYGDDLTETEKKEFLETANKETDRLARLVNDVLDLSRLESAKIYELNPVEIIQPIEQTLRNYQLNAKDKGITLAQDIEDSLPPVVGHYDLLLQLFTNLVGNSLKFTESGGKVLVRAYQVEYKNTLTPVNKIRIEISDTGIGIDQDDQEAIFDRFFRVENRVHTLEGTGLGLSIVKNIIEKHFSQINLISEVGVGTTFWFDLDIYQEEETLKPDLSNSHSSVNNNKYLDSIL